MKRLEFLLCTAGFVCFQLFGMTMCSVVNCYSCSYSSTYKLVTSSCTLTRATGNGTCHGTMCRTTWAEVSPPNNNIRAHECSNDLGDVPSINECQGKTVNNKSFFVYQQQCCYTTGEVFSYGTVYSVTECYCQSDYCNSATSFPMNDGDMTSASTYQLMSYSTIKDPNYFTTSNVTGPKSIGTRVRNSLRLWATIIQGATIYILAKTNGIY